MLLFDRRYQTQGHYLEHEYKTRSLSQALLNLCTQLGGQNRIRQEKDMI